MVDEQHVRVSVDPMTLEEVLAVADGSAVEVTDEALDLMRQSRSVVDAAIDRDEAIYGVTTWVGHARDERLPTEALEALQPFLVEMHVGAIGDRLPTELVRAGMVTRLNGFARGGAGVSLGVARSLEGMLNNRIHPVIPRTGSVGSGDLGQLALLGRALLGRGKVEWNGEIVDAAEALRGAGVPIVSLQPKDALGVISSNALTVGHGALLWRSIGRLLSLADLVAATSLEAIGANPSFFDAAVSAARGSAGQIETSSNLRNALSGSALVAPEVAASVQDPLSFRVVPQVHGACRDVLAIIGSNLVDELNAASDNPLVDLGSGRILSNGNFQVMNVALSAESLRLALAHVGLLSERRTAHLWDTVVTSLGNTGSDGGGPPLDEGTPPAFAGLSLRYPAAVRYTRLRQLAQPVTLDVPPLDLSMEDHATNASEALLVTSEAAEIVAELLTVEALIAYARLLTAREEVRLGAGTEKLVEVVANELGTLPDGTLPDETHKRVGAALSGQLDTILDMLVSG